MLTSPRRVILSAACVALSCVSALAGEPVDAVTTARHDLKLAVPVGGVVKNVPIKSGDRVEAGQVLLELRDDEGAALVELYTLRSESPLEVQAAEANLRVAEVELKAVKQMSDRGAVSPIEVERAQAKRDVASIEADAARQRQLESKQQLLQAQARHDQYVLKAPIAGVIDTALVSVGETVEPLKPVLRLVVTDPLWIDAPVPTGEAKTLKVGDPAWVTPKRSTSDGPVLSGRIIHIAEVADAASETCQVRVEAPNTSALKAGEHVTVTFTEPAPARAAVE